MKHYYARIIVHRLVGYGATIYSFIFSVGPAPLADFASPAPSQRARALARIFSGSGTHYGYMCIVNGSVHTNVRLESASNVRIHTIQCSGGSELYSRWSTILFGRGAHATDMCMMHSFGNEISHRRLLVLSHPNH